MKKIASFTCDYTCNLTHSRSITVPDIRRDVFYDPDEDEEIICFHATESKKISDAINKKYPNYFKKRQLQY